MDLRCPGNHVFDGGLDPPGKRAIFGRWKEELTMRPGVVITVATCYVCTGRKSNGQKEIVTVVALDARSFFLACP